MIQGIVNAFTHALGTVFDFIPRLVGFLIILLVGWIVAYAVQKVVTLLLHKVGFERFAERAGLTRLEQRMGMRMDTAGILGKIAFWFVFLIFLIPAFDSLQLATISNILNTIVAYLPNVFVAVLVLFLGTLLAVFAGDMVRGATRASRLGNPNLLAAIARWAIIAFAAMIALDQLRIAPTLITALFTAITFGLALAFGLAFGLGGRESAQRWFARNESAMLGNRPYNPEQIVQQAKTDLAHSEQLGQQYPISREATPTHTAQPTVPPAPPTSSTSSSGYLTGYSTQQTVPHAPETYGEQPPQRPRKPQV
ncbi:MAG: mechanosensitive ion channel family protein [Ktedonobacteraceae bacterium]